MDSNRPPTPNMDAELPTAISVLKIVGIPTENSRATSSVTESEQLSDGLTESPVSSSQHDTHGDNETVCAEAGSQDSKSGTVEVENEPVQADGDEESAEDDNLDTGDGDTDAEDDGVILDDHEAVVVTETTLDAALSPLTYVGHVFPDLKCIFKLNETQRATDIAVPSGSTSPRCTVSWPTFSEIRSSVVLHVGFARDMNPQVNPDQKSFHGLFITIHCPSITQIGGLELQSHDSIREQWTLGAGFHYQSDQNEVTLFHCHLTATMGTVGNGRIPPLATPELDRLALELCQSIRAGDFQLEFLIRNNERAAYQVFETWKMRYEEEKHGDPCKRWLKNTPRAMVVSMGSLQAVGERPMIQAQQHHKDSFFDRWDIAIPLLYGARYEQEFIEATAMEYEEAKFEVTLLDYPGVARIEHDAVSAFDGTNTSYMSTAHAYIGFADFTGLDLVRPPVGTKLFICLDAEAHQAIDPTLSTEVTLRPVPDPSRAPDPTEETGNDAEHDAYDEEDPDIRDKSEDTWVAYVTEPTALTPSGCITFIMTRRKVQNFSGFASDRPHVSRKLPVVNLKGVSDYDQMTGLISTAEKMSVGLSFKISDQEFKDWVRCHELLFNQEKNSNQQKRICAALLAHDPAQSPLDTVDVSSMFCSDSSRFFADLNTSQRGFVDSLSSALEIILLWGCFGSGKSEVASRIAMAIIAASRDNQVVYFVETNKAVDDAARRFDELARQFGVPAVVTRLHALPGEKIAVYPEFATPNPTSSNEFPTGKSSEQSNEDVAYATAVHVQRYLGDIMADHQRKAGKRDRRRVLEDLSLAKQMANMINSNPDYSGLRLMLREYAQDGYHGTRPEVRTQISSQLTGIMAIAIRRSNIIVAPTSMAGKTTLANNCMPKLVILDEATLTTEPKSHMIFAQFPATAYLIIGDHKQKAARVMSMDTHKDTGIQYLNPFAPQYGLPMFTRLIRAGHPYHMLDIQHRCLGEIAQFPSERFYYGRLQTATPSTADALLVDRFRNYIHGLGTGVRTNRYLRDVVGSRDEKESGGTSTFNEQEVEAIMIDLEDMVANNLLKGLRIAIFSPYSAQLYKIKQALKDHGLTADVIDTSTITFAVAQGTQYDVSMVSFAKTGGDVRFINDAQSLNVGLTRGRYITGIYSNFNIVRQARKKGRTTQHNHWIVSLLEDCEAKGHVIRDSQDSNMITEPRETSNRPCYKCLLPTHKAADCNTVFCKRCKEQEDFDAMYGHEMSACTKNPTTKCRRCIENNDWDHAIGHKAGDCDRYPRSEAHTTCKGCGQLGHSRKNCTTSPCPTCGEIGHYSIHWGRVDQEVAEACPGPRCETCLEVGHLNCKKKFTRRGLQELQERRNALEQEKKEKMEARAMQSTSEFPVVNSSGTQTTMEGNHNPATGTSSWDNFSQPNNTSDDANPATSTSAWDIPVASNNVSGNTNPNDWFNAINGLLDTHKPNRQANSGVGGGSNNETSPSSADRVRSVDPPSRGSENDSDTQSVDSDDYSNASYSTRKTAGEYGPEERNVTFGAEDKEDKGGVSI